MPVYPVRSAEVQTGSFNSHPGTLWRALLIIALQLRPSLSGTRIDGFAFRYKAPRAASATSFRSTRPGRDSGPARACT